MIVLGLETSCDETAAAIYTSADGLISHCIYSQIPIHQRYGGVVPELASRDHVRKALPMIDQVLRQANISIEDVGGVAYTRGPGLIGALMVGASLARSLAYGLQVPCIGVHHMEAHLMAVMLEPSKPEFPFLALLVSGGHTQLVAVREFGDYSLLGESLDDAVGEAFDKTAKLLGLPYPGGPALAQLAEQGDPQRFHFPRPMLQHADLNFSFSGLKTYAMNTLKTCGDAVSNKADIARAFEDAVVETLVTKCQRAIVQTGLDRLVMVGGVSANKKLRHTIEQELAVQVYYPRHEFCTDNAAMVAYTGWVRLQAGESDDLAIQVRPRWPMTELRPIS